MATETAPINGLYGTNPYSQPAELAASTPSVPTHAPSTSQSTTTSATTQQPKADPQEIGWYFVEQYYTTLSKTPEKIHLFYSKKSQLVSGVEAEKIVPSVGTKVCRAIPQKTLSPKLTDDCRRSARRSNLWTFKTAKFVFSMLTHNPLLAILLFRSLVKCPTSRNRTTNLCRPSSSPNNLVAILS